MKNEMIYREDMVKLKAFLCWAHKAAHAYATATNIALANARSFGRQCLGRAEFGKDVISVQSGAVYCFS